MGGNVFENCERIEGIDSYHNAIVDNSLLFPRRVFITPRTLDNKNSFGDLDVLCDGNYKQDILSILVEKGIPHKCTGTTISYLSMDNNQVDILLTPTTEIDYAHNYYSFGDISIIMRVMFKGSGFKHSSKGLKYIHKKYGIEHVFDYSCDYNVLLTTLSLDANKFHDGFSDENDLFEWVTSSPYFDASLFHDIEYMFNSKTRKNVKKRKMFMSFMDYVKDKKFKPSIPIPSPYDDLGCKSLIDLEFQKLLKEKNDKKLYHSKFNGIIVNQVTGLSKRDLGLFMTAFKGVYHFRDILKMSHTEVINAISSFYKDGWC